MGFGNIAKLIAKKQGQAASTGSPLAGADAQKRPQPMPIRPPELRPMPVPQPMPIRPPELRPMPQPNPPQRQPMPIQPRPPKLGIGRPKPGLFGNLAELLARSRKK